MLKWWRGRSEQPDPPAARRPGLQPPLLPRHAGPGHLPGVRSPGDPGVVFFPGQGLPGVSGHADGPAGRSVMIWMQVRAVRAGHARLAAAGVPVIWEPAAGPWGPTASARTAVGRQPDRPPWMGTHRGHDFGQAPDMAGAEPVQRIAESRERLRVAACATGPTQDFIRPNGPGSRPAQPFPHPQGDVAPPAPQISGPSPREDETTYACYALRSRRAPDQCDSAVSSISVLDATGSSAASASI
jgi:hypothetical protein